ncbi:fibronectin type III domain-containing protein [Desulfobulbus alkaliphilus]|uniref:fibronectin type III domain-containing protein n=1 Tax=Desulfobulbus alkaliphilus TaxID=869814 RepID=UPI001962838C|nr:hypothetical protein [Desulfobulbus alkaliphilus]MBM9537696.1 hypothetical protein [Desulfobulbus alkaliphilus]
MINLSRHVVRSILTLMALAILLPLAGCGYKDKPVPPQHIVPRPVNDLQYQLTENGVTLFWSYPRETVTGRNLDNITRFNLYRAVVPVDSYCDTCPIPFAPPIALPGGAVPERGVKTATYQVTVLRPGHLYFFKVRSKSGWWSESEDSNIVSFLWDTPPPAPDNLVATAGDRTITLRWNAVARHDDATLASIPVHYQIYRGVDGGPLRKLGEPIAATTFTDRQVIIGKNYAYQVQSVAMYEQGSVGGGMTASVFATPLDLTPPPIPSGVQAVKTDVGIKIFWNHVQDDDLAGYRIYRRSATETEPTFVGEVNMPYNLFTDTAAPLNQRLYYSVSSIDQQTPANESARSAEVMVAN